MPYAVYIMTNPSRTLYIGMTNDLTRRVYEHQHHVSDGFTARYNVVRLAYYEQCDDVSSAIAREKQLKGWRRSRKIAMIESVNPDWRDLSRDWDP